MTKDKALKLALEALETIDGWLLARYPCGLMPKEQEAITAIKEVLAQPKQEPVIDKSAAIRIATSLGWTPQRTWVGLSDEDMADITSLPIGTCSMMLKVEAKLKEKNTPEQEPVANTTGHCENHKQKGGCQLHNLQCGWPDCNRKPITAPPQRKPLTDEEIDALAIDKDGLPNSHLEFARAIEAAHNIKEKQNGQ